MRRDHVMKSRQPLNVAVVGAGPMGRWHAHFASKAGGTVVAVIDPDTEAAQRLAKRLPKAAVFSALDAALDCCAIHAVHICTPTRSHFALASAALDRGTHVLVEKPMTATAAEAEQLVSTARARGLLMTPVHQFPFQRGFQQLRVERDRLGAAARVAFLCCTAGGRSLGAAERRALLVEILPHPLSLFYALFGDHVFDSLQVIDSAADGDVEVGGRFNQIRISATVSLEARPTQLGLSYLGTRGSGYVDLFHGFYVSEDGAASRGTKVARPLALGAKTVAAAGVNLIERAFASEWAYPGLLELTRRFYGSIRYGQPPPIEEAEVLGTARALDRFRCAILGDGEDLAPL